MSFFEVKPKIMVIMIIYISLFYMCNLAFMSTATYDNTEFGFVESQSQKYGVENETVQTEEEARVEQGYQNATIFALLTGGFLGGAIWFLPDKRLSMIISSIIFPVSTAVGFGTGYSGIEIISAPINTIYTLIEAFYVSVLNFIITLADFMTFGLIDNPTVPSVPYPFNLISFVLVMPVTLVLTIWIVGLVIEGVRSVKVPLAG